MYTTEELKEIVEKTLGNIKYPELPSELYAPISYSLSVGGKRTRPVLALMSANLFTDRMTDKVILPAVGLEVFHGFTLVHDDIMDKADMRRNQVTVHKKWNQNVAILSGDAMLIEAYKLISRSDPAYLLDILQCFNKTASEVCEGQQYDMNYENSPVITEDDYLRMIRLKTASLMATGTRIGAMAVGAPAADCERMYKFGLNIGWAFQIQDDLLDTYGETKVFGKMRGRDIAANKKTYLLVLAIRLAKDEQKQQLNALLKVHDMPVEEKFAAVKSIYDELKIKDFAQDKIKSYFRIAIKEIESVDVKPERKKNLLSFTNALMGREA
ncbi:MAG: polyprenyl synthetase family protein [Prevotellaceae bacterium]|jgi:geranylgeranyl diphosphate synthase type II|nr:polyprenyl synthetase family protein [Prevotellaceae bacterium]